MKLGNPNAKVDGVIETIDWDPRDAILVKLTCTEFTCRCPITKQPDWARIVVTYKPDAYLVESKSFKLYLETFRETGIFHEKLAIAILDDLIDALDPLACGVTVHFNTRGGIAISAQADWEDK